MLAGRTIVVTGAARGVGRAIARACAAAGARLILADILEEGGRDVAQELGKTCDVRFVPIDLADLDSVATFARDVSAREGEIHASSTTPRSPPTWAARLSTRSSSISGTA